MNGAASNGNLTVVPPSMPLAVNHRLRNINQCHPFTKCAHAGSRNPVTAPHIKDTAVKGWMMRLYCLIKQLPQSLLVGCPIYDSHLQMLQNVQSGGFTGKSASR